MDRWSDKRQLVRIAKLYYFEGLTQSEIANKVGISRPIISKMLQRARECGIVEIVIKDDTLRTVELEQALESAFPLKEAVVVPVDGGDGEINKRDVGKAAGQFVVRHLKTVKRLGISWGTTLNHMVREIPFVNHEKLKILPLVGGIGRSHIEIHSNQLAYELSKKLNCDCEFLYAPAVAESVRLKQELMSSAEIRHLLEEAKRVDLAVVGIGNPLRSTMVKMGYLNSEDLDDLRRHGAAGDINSRFIDAEGKELSIPLTQKTIGIELPPLRRIPVVVGVAFGVDKARAILAALRGQYINVLVTDEAAAKHILNLHRNHSTTG